ncbi:MAG: hypothetical protein RLZZ628_1845 [Bacteroidota bacterium]|jgi:hypothetical protein
MKKFLLLALITAALPMLRAQNPNWAENIAPILYKNCAKCHQPNGVAPFSLLTYDDAYRNRSGIKTSVVSKTMPPWSPDPNYNHFANERILSNADIMAITTWVNAGAPQGNLANAPTPPTFAVGGDIVNPDLVLTIPTYTVNTATDLYRCFVLPSKLVGDRFITSLEVIPGNRRIVHHVLAFQDSTNTPAQLDAADPAPGYTNYGGVGSSAAQLVTGWVPGQGAINYPQGMGIRLTSGTNLVLQVHYPSGIVNQRDSTKIVLKFAPANATVRELYVKPILAHVPYFLTNGPLEIPANQTKTFIEKLVLPRDGSFLSIAPHMHLIGRRTKVFAVTPKGDTTRLINIPDWDFNWQGAYTFRKVMKLTVGTTLFAEAFYDNTSNNPYNPNNPPQLVVRGEGTKDEMMLNYFTFMEYRAGDENIVLDSTPIVNSTFEALKRERLSLICHPNPAQTAMNLTFQLPNDGFGNIDIFAMNGVAVKNVTRAQRFTQGENNISISTSDLAAGMYLVRFSSETMYGVQQFIRVE